jgi:xanthine dehydrogenase accessory factor
MTDHMLDNMPSVALDYIAKGHKAALATVMQTWGSAPRSVGAQLAICSDGTFQGSVSGGCVEGAVVAEALAALETGQCRILEYGVSDEQVFAVGLACGGEIKILVEPIGVGQGPDVALLAALVNARKDRQPIGTAVNLQNWTRRLIGPTDAPARFASDKSGVDGDTFSVIQNPPLRLIVVGAVHIAQALLPMARLAGYAPFLIDPRDSFGSQARFPGETILNDWPDTAIKTLGLDARTAVVTLTHDPKLDTPALAAALTSDAFYIGALGSSRTHAKRRAALADQGFAQTQIDRINGPVGANIGAATPAEIAVSILAQMTLVLRSHNR